MDAILTGISLIVSEMMGADPLANNKQQIWNIQTDLIIKLGLFIQSLFVTAIDFAIAIDFTAALSQKRCN